MSSEGAAADRAGFVTFCGSKNCERKVIDRRRAALIAVFVSVLVFVGKWIALEKSVEAMDKMTARLHLNSPTPQMIELNDKFPILWWVLVIVIATMSAIIHGLALRHHSYPSVVMGAFGVPSGAIVVLWVGVAIAFGIW